MSKFVDFQGTPRLVVHVLYVQNKDLLHVCPNKGVYKLGENQRPLFRIDGPYLVALKINHFFRDVLCFVLLRFAGIGQNCNHIVPWNCR